jgi:hypothetical protein
MKIKDTLSKNLRFDLKNSVLSLFLRFILRGPFHALLILEKLQKRQIFVLNYLKMPTLMPRQGKSNRTYRIGAFKTHARF